jgi:DNA-binding NtrC family response regulator
VPERLWRLHPFKREALRVAVHEGPRPPRVLLGNVEPMVRLGMTMVLEENGIEVIGAEERPHALVLLSGRLGPDAVVLDLEQAASRDLAERVRLACPETTVIFWARDEDVMEVLDPGASEPRRFFESVFEELRSELVRSQVNRVER